MRFSRVAETLNDQVKGNGIKLLNVDGKKTTCRNTTQTHIIDADAYQIEKFTIRARPCVEIIEVA